MSMRDKIENHEPLLVGDAGEGRVSLGLDDFRELVQLAHEAIHPGQGSWEGLFDPDEDDDSSVERGYDETNLRATAMHYAAQLEMARMQASHGLDVAGMDPVGHAESILNFLRGRS